MLFAYFLPEKFISPVLQACIMRKWLIFWILLVLLVTGFLWWFITSLPPSREETFREEKPTDWIKITPNATTIDVSAATFQSQVPIMTQQRYLTPEGTMATIFFDGVYQGNIFSGTYAENDAVKMRLFSDMNPNDGIIEAYAFLRKENDKFVLYTFVDEDWRKMSQNHLFITWGENIRNPAAFKTKPFVFDVQSNGIWINKLEDVDFLTTQNPVRGRVFIGDITRDDVAQDNFNKTFLLIT